MLLRLSLTAMLIEMECDITISQVRTEVQLHDIKLLVEEYLKTIPYDLSFQDVQKELQDMPGKYVLAHGG